MADEELNLRALRVFVETAQLQSITRAAVSLGIAQSAVSRMVAELERRFGGRLFLRTGRGVAPTPLTLDLLPRIMSLLADAGELDERARYQSGSPAGLVILGLVPAWAGPIASRLLSGLREELPRVRLRVLEGYSGEIEEWLASGRIDIGMLNRYQRVRQIGHRRLLTSDMHLIGRPASFRHISVPRDAEPLTLRALGACPLVLPSRPNALRSALDAWQHDSGQVLNIVIEADAYSIIRRLLLDHDLFSILPAHAVAEELAAGMLAAERIHERELRQSVMLVPGSHRPSTQASRAVLQRIPGVVRELLAEGPSRGRA